VSHESGVSGRAWAAVAAPPLAWAAQGLAGWYVSGQACANGGAGWGTLSPAGVRVLVACITALSIATTAWALLTGYRRWTSTAGPRHARVVEGLEAAEFVSAAALLMGAALLLGLVWAALPVLLVDVCGGV
jgi:hypothetical protein